MKCYDCTLGILNNGNKVEGSGNPKASLMIIGEAPGYREQRLGIPFIGKSGVYLKGILQSLEYNMSDIYYTNAVHCRPPENRTPSPMEIKKCKHYVYEEILAVNPKHIICVGSTASSLLVSNFTGVNKLLGKRLLVGNISVYFNYHPSFIMRNIEFEDQYISNFIIIKQKINGKVNNYY